MNNLTKSIIAILTVVNLLTLFSYRFDVKSQQIELDALKKEIKELNRSQNERFDCLRIELSYFKIEYSIKHQDSKINELKGF
jgi:hypothetical protein